MKEGYKVLGYKGKGLFIEVYNYEALNEIAHYRYSKDYEKLPSSSRVGVWKPKLIKS
jgi:hypothetical protein